LLYVDPDCSSDGKIIKEVKTFFHFFILVICTYAYKKKIQAAHVLVINAFLFPAVDAQQWSSDALITRVNLK
jgi:hypothetical protein